ncbi:hypothetical protein [Sphingobacterium sp. CZ-UAM]|uniref:hypothetical protein n=1 Tax=Sphingobacterium sp. CZ-UAM TaxID=1933868 RepID=UPI0011158902|nr:hypothetical protein [Sphingobacterium sp. CZ-UAM]
MKNIIRLTVMLLLVSSCGLFKKSVKTKESQTLKTGEKMTILSNVDSNKQRLDMEQTYNRLSTQTEDLIQIAGEEIEIRPNGVVRIGRGQVNKKRIHSSDSSIAKDRYLFEQRRELVHSAQYKEDKLRLDTKASKRTVQPAAINILYFLIGLLAIILVVWWKRKRV